MYNIAIIGAGPGGQAAALAARQHGLSAVLFEKAQLGGTCLNRGCIPTKALLHSAEAYAAAKGASKLGVECGGVSYSFASMHARKAEVVNMLREGAAKTLKIQKADVVEGAAQITAPHEITCNGETYEAENIIVACGSQAALPPIEGIGSEGVCTSDDVLEGEGHTFKSLIIVGGGVIGVETASIYLPLGCDVTILEGMDHILPAMDKELATRLTASLKKQGATIEAKALVQRIEGVPGNMTVTYQNKKGEACTATAEGVLIATGRRANLGDVFAEGLVPETERGALVCDEAGRASIESIWAIGDCRAHTVQLAHVAEAQGKNVVAAIAGENPPVNEALVPSCIYTSPEIASVGLDEAQAKKAGHEAASCKALTGANGKCVIEDAAGGYVKLVYDAPSRKLLGAQLMCPRATDLVSELTLALNQGLTVDQLASAIHPHPTFSELILSAAQSA